MGKIPRACGLATIPIANRLKNVTAVMNKINPAGVLLTGGGDIAELGGTDQDRDKTENVLIDWALAKKRPILGVCRGMQLIQSRFGVCLEKVTHHVAVDHEVFFNWGSTRVNSFHEFGTYTSIPELEIIATSKDGCVEAINHCTENIMGIMWHPERQVPFRADDLELFKRVFMSEQL